MKSYMASAAPKADNQELAETTGASRPSHWSDAERLPLLTIWCQNWRISALTVQSEFFEPAVESAFGDAESLRCFNFVVCMSLEGHGNELAFEIVERLCWGSGSL
jgi:hypothetical protein